MAGFNAGSSVEPLEYDFTTVEGGKGKGAIPEPSQEQLEEFSADFQALVEEVRQESSGSMSEDSPEDMLVQMRDLRRRSTEIVSKLCSGQPSVEEIESLPPRLQTAFSKWVRQEMTDPNLKNGATAR